MSNVPCAIQRTGSKDPSGGLLGHGVQIKAKATESCATDCRRWRRQGLPGPVLVASALAMAEGPAEVEAFFRSPDWLGKLTPKGWGIGG